MHISRRVIHEETNSIIRHFFFFAQEEVSTIQNTTKEKAVKLGNKSILSLGRVSWMRREQFLAHVHECTIDHRISWDEFSCEEIMPLTVYNSFIAVNKPFKFVYDVWNFERFYSEWKTNCVKHSKIGLFLKNSLEFYIQF